MARAKPKVTNARFVVMKMEKAGLWLYVGETNRQPGLTARAARAKAINDLFPGTPRPRGRFAVIPRSEWRTALDNDLL